MKQLFYLFITFIFTLNIQAQNLKGAWEAKSNLESGQSIKHLIIFSDNYFVMTAYDENSSEFISTKGGFYSYQNGKLIQKFEFNTANPEQVSQQFVNLIDQKKLQITFVESGMKFLKLDDGLTTDLSTSWIFAGRKTENGEISHRAEDHSRKTMKLLSGSKFQWIAFDVDSKQFFGTGGGAYTVNNGIYTETIEFFSRDISRVGNQLEFRYEVIEGNWHHSGLSSKGDPIYEIWTQRN